MNKSELLVGIQKKLGKDATKACAECSLNAVLEAIKDGIKKEKSVQLMGFGTFSVALRKARNGVNPQTKKPIKIAASKTVKFKPSARLREFC